MSHASTTGREKAKVDANSSQPLNPNVSVMRDFLESDTVFQWPLNMGKCSGNHCDISWDRIPLKWKGIISDKTNASIDRYEAGPDFSFQKTFVVKTIRETDTQKATKMTANEIENMRDLRHPHVTALLGTFTYQARLSILIFPAACCNLHQFMEGLSRGFGQDRGDSHSDGTSTVGSDTTNFRPLRDSNVGSASNHKENDPQEVPIECWPLIVSVDKRNDMLRGFFVCLSQALSYLHSSDIRHKDIKPENILIDESGSVILTDFGISRRFPKHTPHATNNERKFTRKYASPEIMNHENTFRDDPSDVFSLGCVFLEMATLLLGRDLSNLSDYYATMVNDSGREEAYHCNLTKVYSWIDYLRTSGGFEPVQEHWLLGETNKNQNFDPSPDNHITAALVDIRQMLDKNPSNRPVSKTLWQRFQHISAMRCRDCDPRRPGDIWKPSARQQKDAQTGLNNRRSLHAKPDSPPIRLNMDTREDGAESARSPTPRLRIVQNEEMFPEETGPGIALASAPLSPAYIIQQRPADFGRQPPDDLEPTPSLQLPRSQATNVDLSPSNQLAIRQDRHSRAPNQRRATGGDNPASELKKYPPPLQKRIIVCDVSQTIAYETVFASLKDQDHRKYPLPRFRRRVEIKDNADLIAKVDLGQLKFGTTIRRCMGDFPLIYVLNYAAQPLQIAKRPDLGF